MEMEILWIGLTLAAATITAIATRYTGPILLSTVYAGLLTASQIITVKQIPVFGQYVTAGVITYSITYYLTDILSEFYGKKEAQKTVWGGFLASIFLVLSLEMAIRWEPAPFFQNQAAFASILGSVWRITLASFVAFLVSQHWDVYIFDRMRSITGESRLWARNLGSTLSSQFIDSVIFLTIAFYGVRPILPLLIGEYIVKSAIAALDTPFMYAVKGVWNHPILHSDMIPFNPSQEPQ